jgi:RsmE family RNA methyltransferase
VNLLLLEPSELGPGGVARIGERRARHVREVLRCQIGETIAVGIIGGEVGTAEILASGEGAVELRIRLGLAPPPPSPVTLVLARPRPPNLRKVLQAIGAMGLKRLILLGSWKVEKAYWGSPLLAPAALREELLLGLEQGRDTVLPEVILRRFFKPFVEDELDALFGPTRLLLDLAATRPLWEVAPPARGGVTLAVGPEGGWTPYEAAELEKRGFLPVSLGPRPLRVDQAVPFAVGQAELWLARREPSAQAGTRPPGDHLTSPSTPAADPIPSRLGDLR